MYRWLLALFSFAALQAQSPYGRITGRITDAAGALVPGAAITVTNTETNVTAKGVSNAEGNYEVLNLIPGQYRVTAEMQGFKKYERGPIELRVGDVLNVEIALTLGSVSDSITVTAEAPIVDSANASVGQVIDHRRIVDLPLSGGSAMYLIQMTPGVITTNPPTHGWLPFAIDVESDVATGGTRTRSSEFMLDGIPNMTADGSFAFSPPQELVQEFRVNTSSYDASMGHFTGAQINMTLKSGTNTPHGTLFFSHNSRPLLARDFFTNRYIHDTSTGPVTKQKMDEAWPAVLNNRYRATATGPVYLPKIYDGRNRTFFTWGFDKGVRDKPQHAFFTVPTAEQRRGDFSRLLGLGSQYQIYDPDTIAPAAAGRFSRQPFPGNIIPASRLDGMAQRILSYYSLPNTAGTADGLRNYSDPQPMHVDYDSQIVRIDQAISQNHRLFGSLTWSFADGLSGQMFHNIARGGGEEKRHRGFSLDDTMVLRPNMVLAFRYGFTRFRRWNRPKSVGFDLGSLGFPPSLVGQLDREATAFPEILIDDFAALGAASGFRNATTYHNASGSLSYLRGNHSLRLGGEYRVLQENNLQFGSVSPHMDFSTLWTRGPLDNSPEAPVGQGLAAFVLGQPTGGYIDRSPAYSQQSGYTALFLQDDWKLTRKLTLNIGMRWELEVPTTERYNRTNRGFDFAAASPIQDAARANYARSPIAEVPLDQFRTTGGLLFAGVNGQPRGLWNAHYNNFSPRFGLAYMLRPQTVLRAGYGIFYQSIGADRVSVFQQGFSQRTNLSPSLDNGLNFRATLSNPFPDGLLEPKGASGGLATYVGRSPGFFTPGRKPGYMQRWSMGFQHELPGRILLDAGYVGNRGTGLGSSQEFNPIPARYLSASPVRDQAAIDRLTQAVTNPFFGIPQFEGSNLQARTVQRSQLLRPYPQFVSVSSALSNGFSWYHSLQVRVERRFSRGYTVSASYTWSKFMEAIERLNASDTTFHHVISPQDRPHHLVMSGILELPLGRGRRWMRHPGVLDYVFGGWSVQAIYNAQSGAPLEFGNVLFMGDIHDIVLPRSERTPERWFNTGAGFERDQRKLLGSNLRTFPLRFNNVRGDGFNNWDMSVFKNFRLRERLKLQLRGEAQDALNHALFARPNMVPTSTLFGQVNGIQGTEQRRITVCAKLLW